MKYKVLSCEAEKFAAWYPSVKTGKCLHFYHPNANKLCLNSPHLLSTAHSFLVPKGWSALSWRDNGEAGRTEDQYHYWLWAAHSGRTWRALRRASRARHDLMPSFLKKMSWDMKSCKDQDWIVHLFKKKKVWIVVHNGVIFVIKMHSNKQLNKQKQQNNSTYFLTQIVTVYDTQRMFTLTPLYLRFSRLHDRTGLFGLEIHSWPCKACSSLRKGPQSNQMY